MFDGSEHPQLSLTVNRDYRCTKLMNAKTDEECDGLLEDGVKKRLKHVLSHKRKQTKKMKTTKSNVYAANHPMNKKQYS